MYIELLLFFLSLQGAIDWRGLRRLSDQDTLLLSRAKLYNILIYCGWLSAIWPSLKHCKDKPHATPTSPPPIPLPPKAGRLGFWHGPGNPGRAAPEGGRGLGPAASRVKFIQGAPRIPPDRIGGLDEKWFGGTRAEQT